MGWSIEESSVALRWFKASKSDTIDGHYVAQYVTLASHSVVQLVYEGLESSSFTANIAVDKRHIHRNRT
jgi:hypothetical protein